MRITSFPRVGSPWNEARKDPPTPKGPHGDPCSLMHKFFFWIVGWNPGGLPQDNGKEKNQRLRAFINEWSLDVLCLSEVNVAWHLIAHDHRLGERVHS